MEFWWENQFLRNPSEGQYKDWLARQLLKNEHMTSYLFSVAAFVMMLTLYF
jgi:hypothetical protein